MSLHDPAAKSETEAIAGNITAVKALENGKHLLMKSRLNARTIVANGHDHFALPFIGGQMNLRRRQHTKLQSVGDEVLQEQAHLEGVRIYFGERVVGDQGLRLRDLLVK